MSIHALMHEPPRTRTRPASSGALKGPGDQAKPPLDIPGTLAKYIPSEALAVYISVLAFLVPENTPLADQDFTSRWVLGVVVLILAVLYAVGEKYRAAKQSGEHFRFPTWKVVTVVVAFIAWLFAIPGSPLGSFDWYTPTVGAIVGIIVNAFLGAGALFFESGA